MAQKMPKQAQANLYPLKCQLSAGRRFRQNPGQYYQLETQAS